MSADRNLDHLYPPFTEKVRKVLADLHAWTAKNHPEYTFSVVEGLRDAAYQHSLYEQGRTKPGQIVTNNDGYKHPSNHQSGLAVDLVPFKKGQPDWKAPKEFWDFLGHCARAQGLKYGGDWKSFIDLPHVEHDPKDKATYAKAKAWLKEQGLA